MNANPDKTSDSTMKSAGASGGLGSKKSIDTIGGGTYTHRPLVSETTSMAPESYPEPVTEPTSPLMIHEVVIAGAWRGFEEEVSEWAQGTQLRVSRKMGMVICASENLEELHKLQVWLKAAVKSGLPEDIVSFESALFPPMTAGGKPTLIHGLAARRERKVLEELPCLASTPLSMVRPRKVHA